MDSTLPYPYGPVNLFDTVGKFFENILLAMFTREIHEHGLRRDELFGFRPRQSTTLQLARLVQIVNRNFDERRLTGAVFPDVAKALRTVFGQVPLLQANRPKHPILPGENHILIQ
jgi:hypothetical protein